MRKVSHARIKHRYGTSSHTKQLSKASDSEYSETDDVVCYFAFKRHLHVVILKLEWLRKYEEKMEKQICSLFENNRGKLMRNHVLSIQLCGQNIEVTLIFLCIEPYVTTRYAILCVSDTLCINYHHSELCLRRCPGSGTGTFTS